MNVKIYADGADYTGIMEEYKKGQVQGFTTNPSLMKKAGITDYKAFAAKVLDDVRDMPFSFEVFADTFPEMVAEAREIASWGDNIYVKIPVTNTEGEFTGPVIEEVVKAGVKVNITAVFTIEQVKDILNCLDSQTPAIISIFAGRISDTGVDTTRIIRDAVALAADKPNVEILWASCRDLYSIVEADQCGCQIITVPNAILSKISLFEKDLQEYSLETVRDFFKDASSLGYTII